MNPRNHQHQPLPLFVVNSSSSTSSSSSSLKTRFALRFLQSLKTINNSRTTNPSSSTISSLPSSSDPKNSNLIRKRSKRVKIAADASMASLIGSRRVWSRAVISNLRRLRNNHATSTSLKTAPTATTQKLKKNKIKKKKKKTVPGQALSKRKLVVATGGRESQLRNLVPGGNDMDACTLLDETAHYIQCLATQVMVMRNIVHHCSPSPP